MFITAFTSARHLFLSWASSIQSIPPHSTTWRSILILSSHLSLGLPNCLFPSGFPNKPCTHLSPPPYALHAPPIHRQEYEINWQKKTGHTFSAFPIDVLRESIHSLSFRMQKCVLEPMLKSKINCSLWASKWRRNFSNRTSHVGDTAIQVNPFTLQSPSTIARSHQNKEAPPSRVHKNWKTGLWSTEWAPFWFSGFNLPFLGMGRFSYPSCGHTDDFYFH